MAWLTAAEVIAWGQPGATVADQAVLDAAILAAQALIEGYCGRKFDKTTLVQVFDGDKALGKDRDILILDPGLTPVIHTTNPDLVTVTENGISLTVTTGYTTTADVILRGANLDQPCYAIRRGREWAEGIQNISISTPYGYQAASLPADLKQACKELAWGLYKRGRTVDLDAQANPGGSASISTGISGRVAQMLNNHRRFR